MNCCKLVQKKNVFVKFIANGVTLNDVNFIYVKYKHDANAD